MDKFSRVVILGRYLEETYFIMSLSICVCVCLPVSIFKLSVLAGQQK